MRSSAALDGLAGQVIAVGGTGMFWSVVFRRQRTPAFDRAQRRTIGTASRTRTTASSPAEPRSDLITVMPSVTWRVIRQPECRRDRSRCRRRVLRVQLEGLRIRARLHRGTVTYRPARSDLVGRIPAHRPQATGIDVHVSSRLDDGPHRLRRQRVRAAEVTTDPFRRNSCQRLASSSTSTRPVDQGSLCRPRFPKPLRSGAWRISSARRRNALVTATRAAFAVGLPSATASSS